MLCATWRCTTAARAGAPHGAVVPYSPVWLGHILRLVSAIIYRASVSGRLCISNACSPALLRCLHVRLHGMLPTGLQQVQLVLASSLAALSHQQIPWHPVGATGASISQASEFKQPSGELCHVFISHAGEQKAVFVDMLHEAFRQRYPAVKVFVDERSLQGGGDAMRGIFDNLADAFLGE
jgi:hypothetical protein